MHTNLKFKRNLGENSLKAPVGDPYKLPLILSIFPNPLQFVKKQEFKNKYMNILTVAIIVILPASADAQVPIILVVSSNLAYSHNCRVIICK